MADVASALKGGGGVAFLVSAGLVYECIAAACSSPQTMEINAKTRAGTLMKWVNIGCGQAFVFVVIAAMLDQKHAPHILGGGLLAMGLMYWQYVHAKSCGLRSDAPGTEGQSDTNAARAGYSGEANAFTAFKAG
ncbi:MAG: hypothetical protein ACJ786_36050 [Catenulispora sp.]|jgi:hypothetical protein